MKWRHVMNRLPLDNAALKLKHHAVGQRLAHRKDKRYVCGTRGQGQQSIIIDEKVFGLGLLRPCKVCPVGLQVDAAATVSGQKPTRTKAHRT